jgi:hypothetical protein
MHDDGMELVSCHMCLWPQAVAQLAAPASHIAHATSLHYHSDGTLHREDEHTSEQSLGQICVVAQAAADCPYVHRSY